MLQLTQKQIDEIAFHIANILKKTDYHPVSQAGKGIPHVARDTGFLGRDRPTGFLGRYSRIRVFRANAHDWKEWALALSSGILKGNPSTGGPPHSSRGMTSRGMTSTERPGGNA